MTSFQCRSGRCLPFSWRCNGQVECLDAGAGFGTDEEGCDLDAETPEPPQYDRTPEEGKEMAQVEDEKEYQDRYSEGREDPKGDLESELWSLLGDGGEKEDAKEPPPTRREPLATPTPIEWPCGGLIQTFYGTFSPPALRGPPLSCIWTLDPQDPRPLRLDLQQLVLGPGDRLTVYNREQGNGDIIKIVSFLSLYSKWTITYLYMLPTASISLAKLIKTGFNGR